MLAARLLWRNWRSGEVRLLSIALVMAVMVVSAIAIFTDRLEATLVQQSNNLLGADRVVRASQPHDPAWAEEAGERDLQQSRLVEFSSMVYRGDEMHLASIKAVDEGYPLRGVVETTDQPWTTKPPEEATGIPAPGEAWVDARMLPLLGIELGDTFGVGEAELVASRVLVRQPDGASSIFMTGGRVLMNLQDLPATRVVQPGSRVSYQWLLAADRLADLEGFLTWLEPQLTDHYRVVDIESSQRNLARTLDRGKQFLLLAAVVGVLLAGVAIGLAARQFADRHVDQVALMKSLGAGSQRIRNLYFGQLILLSLVASVIGVGLGEGFQQLVAYGLSNFFALNLAQPGWLAYVLSVLSGLVCLMFFALPALWFLPKVPPLKILRRELSVDKVQVWTQVMLALLAVVLLVVLFSRDWALAASVVAALLVVVVVTAILGLGLLHLSRKLTTGASSVWRLAVANLQRRRGHSLVQMVIFSVAIMLLITLTVVRTSLIQDWQAQLPEDAPNHFLVNVAPEDVEPVQTMLDRESLDRQPLYPMVRGRLTHINEQEKSRERLNREANLTWTDTLAEDNEVVAGQWWDQWSGGELPGVSVEQELAGELGIELGDTLRFSIGGLTMEAEVTSLRTLDWRSMNPNFFFIFEPGALDGFSATYITSAYVPASQKTLINDLMREYPTILLIELDRVFEQIRSIVTQVTKGIQLVLVLTVIGGILVLLAAVTTSLDARKQEAGLLRALGSPRRLVVGSVWAEFSILGGLSGLIAVLGSEALLMSLQHFVLEIPIRPHYLFWVLGPILGAAFVGLLGPLSCRSVVTTPPAVVLREAA
ncbi:FtsX-like permease family protein [uncultured Marinimicrobium sp.]|uniref:ABC transporter permease n=1 Tax=uncultured Marinimicrobium sp. TaxID=503840 RepID=UPI0030D98395